MLYAFFELFKTAALFFLLHEYLRHQYFTPKFSQLYNTAVFNVVMFTISLYTRLEIMYNQLDHYVTEKHPYIANLIKNIQKPQIKKVNLEFIKDNKVFSLNLKNFLNEKNTFVPEYDFILYTDETVLPNNIKILQKNINTLDLFNTETYKCEPSNIKFILLEVEFGNETYRIDLSSDTYNFYIKDNILNKNFFIYYLRNVYESPVYFDTSKQDTMFVKIIDNNVNIHNVDFTNGVDVHIKFNDSGYEIVK